MEQHLQRVHHVMNRSALPEATKSSLREALQDAALRGFHIDIEQLEANLSLLKPETPSTHRTAA